MTPTPLQAICVTHIDCVPTTRCNWHAQFICGCQVESSSAYLCRVCLGRNSLFKDTLDVFLYRKVTLCCRYFDTPAQLRNELNHDIICLVVIVLPHCHSCTVSFCYSSYIVMLYIRLSYIAMTWYQITRQVAITYSGGLRRPLWMLRPY